MSTPALGPRWSYTCIPLYLHGVKINKFTFAFYLECMICSIAVQQYEIAEYEEGQIIIQGLKDWIST
jgi:hypothetical protein